MKNVKRQPSTDPVRRINVTVPGSVHDEATALAAELGVDLNMSGILTDGLNQLIVRLRELEAARKKEARVKIINYTGADYWLVSPGGPPSRIPRQPGIYPYISGPADVPSPDIANEAALPPQRRGVVLLVRPEVARALAAKGRQDVWDGALSAR